MPKRNSLEMVPIFTEKLHEYRQYANKTMAASHGIYHILIRQDCKKKKKRNMCTRLNLNSITPVRLTQDDKFVQ